MNVVGFGGGFAGLVETFSGVVPAADVHHGDAALIMLFGGARILFVRGLHALLGDFQMHARAIGELFAWPFQNFFEFLLGLGKFLLVKKRESFIVSFELCLDERINQLDAAALGRWRRH